jgi:hypothetical protein
MLSTKSQTLFLLHIIIPQNDALMFVFNEGQLPHRLGLLVFKTLMTFSTLNVHRLSRNMGAALRHVVVKIFEDVVVISQLLTSRPRL